MTDTITDVLPAKFTTIRPHQQQAVDEIIAAYDAGADVVFLDAPTGTGKTVIGELVRHRLEARALYVCSDKQLQAQFLGDFPYARVLMGRSNYPVERDMIEPQLDRYGRLAVSADDCTATAAGGKDCWHCPTGFAGCPYHIAKNAAVASPLAVLNTSYLLDEASGKQTVFGGKYRRELVIIDEADTLEDALMGYVQFEVPQWVGRKLGLKYPGKGVHKPTIIKWLRQAARQAREHGKWDDLKQRKRAMSFVGSCTQTADELEKDVTAASSEDDAALSGRWLRDYDTKTLLLKPVIVGPYGSKALWRHGDRFLLMSGTIISSDEMADSLGLPLEYTTVVVPMTFPVENRPIVMAPVADITRRATDDDYQDLVYAVEQVCKRHAGERVLVHTVSKMLAELLTARCYLPDRNVCWYSSAQGRAEALASYLSDENSVLFAQSMDRGVDLPGDACRVVVVAKVPFPSFGDRRIAARTRLPGGDAWYAVQTVRKIVQMTGRGVRSETDHAISYVLDRQFVVNVWAKNQRLLPRWWVDAVDTGMDNRWLMRKYAGTDRATPPANNKISG